MGMVSERDGCIIKTVGYKIDIIRQWDIGSTSSDERTGTKYKKK
jgi:hypothetical protein